MTAKERQANERRITGVIVRKAVIMYGKHPKKPTPNKGGGKKK
jgi:hypothetical protein